jgi:DNA polymerase V|tara:strand:+ start:245 stop:643 length:399 start_codon:yes stop_codon:yes gene_type:complete
MFITFYKEAVECGFPSPARDFTEGSIDLNEELIPHPNSTFVVRARGDSMIGSGIYPNDLVIVDRSLKFRNGSVIIAVVDGELSIKILKIQDKQISLSSANKNYSDVLVSEEMDFTIWGVCTYVVHTLSPVNK